MTIGWRTWTIVAVISLLVLTMLLQPLLSGLYWLGVVASVGIYTLLDWLFCVRLFSGMPWLMWVFWGCILGAGMALWTLAPVYGLRRHRPLIILIPFATMMLISLIIMMVGK